MQENPPSSVSLLRLPAVNDVGGSPSSGSGTLQESQHKVRQDFHTTDSVLHACNAMFSDALCFLGAPRVKWVWRHSMADVGVMMRCRLLPWFPVNTCDALLTAGAAAGKP